MRRKPLLPAALLISTLALAACGVQPPISLAYRDSLVGQGAVVLVTNTSGDYLHEVVVTIESPEGETKEAVFPTLEPHDTLTVGWLKLDGWPIPPGSEVTVRCKGFALPVGPSKISG